MKSDLPKVMHRIAGQPLIRHVLTSLAPLGAERTVIVVAPDMQMVENEVRPKLRRGDPVPGGRDIRVAVQEEPLGTAHAVAASRAALAGFVGDVVVLYGDTPLIKTETIAAMIERRRTTGAAVAVLGMRPPDPGPYGRLVVDRRGGLLRIVEAADASAEERDLDLCNAGFLAVDGSRLFELLDRIGADNAKGEFYLTDIVAAAREEGLECTTVEGDWEELAGVNSCAELATAEAACQRRLRAAALESGVTLVDPDSVFLALDTKLGRDVVIGPHVVLGPGVTLGDRVEIKPFCHIEASRIEAGSVIGPFARLRPGTEIGEDVRIGNFVEVKAARLGAGAKANHLSYIGDAVVGARANIGAGTITCNYDGFGKARTFIGEAAFVGSNTALVAPVTVGARAIIGAGSVITRDVPDDAMAIARGGQVEKPGAAAAFRTKREGERQPVSVKRG
jgi:bifunctional UDP-N-acetylglucosamine pyrophosphorylase/glucosamine-1-phosphate N-acetyltransferase